MRFRGTCRASYAVPSGSSSKKNYNIARLWSLAYNIFRLCRPYYSPYLHAFCGITRMIYFMNVSCCKPYLVTVRTVTGRRSSANLTLRQFAFYSGRSALKRICRSRYAHSLINKGAPGKRVAYRPAKTGSRPSERLNFGRMVVRFVFKHQKPVLFSAVYIYFNFYRTGVYFRRFVQIRQKPAFFQRFCAYCGNIHQCDGFRVSARKRPCFKVIFITFA